MLDVFDISFSSEEHEPFKQIEGFLKTTINGDTLDTHIITQANLDNRHVALIYTLTNLRFIKFEIDKKGNKSSKSFLIRKITSINRKQTAENKNFIEIIFDNYSIGLTYDSEDEQITHFFDKVDEMRTK